MAYYQGLFKPKNPNKYKGDPTRISYRSGWECRLMIRLDTDSSVVWWQSEELAIPYRSPVDKRIHKYFVDFVVHNKNGETMLVEIKPKAQCSPPVLMEGKRMTASHKKKIITYAINQAKWKAATAYAEDRGWKFIVMTEKELNIR